MIGKIRYLLFLSVSCAILSEWKLSPFEDQFRFSFGAAVFFFFLLWNRSVHPVLAGASVGGVIVLFRTAISLLLENYDGPLADLILQNVPPFMYYFSFSVFVYMFRIHRVVERPLLLGMLGTLVDVLSNSCELLARFLMYHSVFTISKFNMIIYIAIFRSYFVVGFLTLLNLKQSKIAEEKMRQRNEEMLLFISDLYEETIQLHSSLQHIEDITHSAYLLYDYLKQKDERADEALRLVGQIHEIKKNNQRIYAGLKKLIDQEKNFDYLNLKELCELVVRSNEKYAGMLGKQIHFALDVQPDHYEVHAFTLLSVINNLVVNAVEAIKETGTITLKVYRLGEQVHISVIDDGPGIPPAKKAVIFNPGYTNKYDHSGKPSTGIGLTYVKQLVESLGGIIAVESNGNNHGAQFLVQLPMNTISTSEGREEKR